MTNGTLQTVKKFDRTGNIVLDDGKVIAKDFGHITHGYCTTSYAAQGKTVDRVMIALGPESFPAASPEQAYVSVSRGRESCTIYCSNKEDLLAAVSRPTERLSATELTGVKPASSGREKMTKHGQIFRRQEQIRRPVEANKKDDDRKQEHDRMRQQSNQRGMER